MGDSLADICGAQARPECRIFDVIDENAASRVGVCLGLRVHGFLPGYKRLDACEQVLLATVPTG